MGPIRNKSHNEMMNILANFAMNSLGFPVGEIFVVTPTTGNSREYWRSRINESRLFTSIQAAYAATVTARNDVILVAPENNTWVGDSGSATGYLTWSKQNVHMLGMSPTNKGGYGRARFSHSSTCVEMLRVSGSGNMFKNVRWMHGSASAGDVTLLNVTGAGNAFENCAFATPMAAAQAAATGYLGVIVAGTQNSWKNCTIGTANDVDRSAANALLSIGAACSGWNIFEDCVFRSRSGGGQATAYFINCADASTVVDTPGIFLNCQFIHTGTQLTVAIAKTTNTARPLFFDNRCSFSNVTDVIADANETEIWWGGSGANADETSIGDRVCLGLAKNPNHTT